jgi:hypothetical protein
MANKEDSEIHKMMFRQKVVSWQLHTPPPPRLPASSQLKLRWGQLWTKLRMQNDVMCINGGFLLDLRKLFISHIKIV